MAEALSAADKTLSVLEALADHSRIADLATASGLPKPTVHRILQTLVRHGFARTDGQGSYVGGPRILSLRHRRAGPPHPP
jgi:IclR family acetate operon transcriptional repressor